MTAESAADMATTPHSPGADRQQDDDVEQSRNDEEFEENDDDNYMLTVSHCYLSRRAILENAANIEFKGRAVIQRGCTLRGNSGIIRLGRYVWLHPGSTFQPSFVATVVPPLGALAAGENQQQQQQQPKSVPMVIGSHTVIGSDCTIRAAAIGSYCWIGKRVTLGNRVIVKDCCVVLDDVVLGDDTVIPPFTLVRSTVPPAARRHRERQQKRNLLASSTASSSSLFAPMYKCTELPPSTPTVMQEWSLEKYATFAESRGK
jgi:dynactin-5